MKNFDIQLFNNGVRIDSNIIQQKSIETMGVELKYWIELNGKNYLYKIDKDNPLGFYELIVSYVCYLLDIECVNAYPAYNNESKQTGVIIQSYITDNNTTALTLADIIGQFSEYYVKMGIDRLEYSVEEIEEIFDNFDKDKFIIEPNIIQKLKQMCVVDYVFNQSDRHYGNIEFLFSKIGEKTSIRIAPMFDNGRCLNFDCINPVAVKKLCNNLNTCLVMSNRQSCKISRTMNIKNISYFICKEIIKNKELKELYSKLKQLDFDKIVDYVANIYPQKLENSRLVTIKETYKYRLNLLSKYIKYAKLGLDNAFIVDDIKNHRIKVPKDATRVTNEIISMYTVNPSLISLKKRNQITINLESDNPILGENNDRIIF